MLKCFCEDPMPLDGDDLCATKCGHIFHDGCLLQWLRINSICPQCRTPISTQEKFRLYPTLSDEPNEPESVVSEALENLDRTQSELNQMTEFCKKKDEVIATLKTQLKEDRFKKEYETLKQVLQTIQGENLDILFDDPELYDSVLKGETTLDTTLSNEVGSANLFSD